MSVDINISNYEPYLLGYIDGELNEAERTALELFIQQHPQAARELEILKAAVLRPDETITFGNREILYRHTAITLQNYETYLLSYIDGELNSAERTALEAFLRQHPHLAQELELLQATRLPADETVEFDNKDLLYRHAATLTPENYETYLLSYIDGELTQEEVSLLQAFLHQHPQAQEELQLLQRTRLQPDATIKYTGKAALYRTAGRRAPLRPIWWWSAAAAVVAGLLVWMLPLQPGNNTPDPAPAVVKVQPPVKDNSPSAPTAPAVQPPARQEPQQPVAAAKTPVPAEQPAKRALAAREEKPAVARNNAAPGQQVGNKPNEARNNGARPDNNQPLPAAGTETANVTTPVLTQLPQQRLVTAPPAEVAAPEKATVLAANVGQQHNNQPDADADEPSPAAAPPTPAPIQGELIMSVSSSSESKLLNGVTNVARFFSRKKNHNR